MCSIISFLYDYHSLSLRIFLNFGNPLFIHVYSAPGIEIQVKINESSKAVIKSCHREIFYFFFFSCGIKPVGSGRASWPGLGIMSKKNKEIQEQYI